MSKEDAAKKVIDYIAAKQLNADLGIGGPDQVVWGQGDFLPAEIVHAARLARD